MKKTGGLIKNRKGSAFAVTMMVLLVLSVLITAYLTLSLTEYKTAIRTEKQKQAYYIARAGAEAVAKHIMDNPDPESVQALLDAPAPSSRVSLGNGAFEVEVIGSIDTKIIVESTGYVGDVSQEARLTLIPHSSAWEPPFEEGGEIQLHSAGVFAEEGIYLHNGGGITGSAITNSVAAHSVRLDNSGSEITGDVLIGPGGDASVGSSTSVVYSEKSNIHESIRGDILNLEALLTFEMPQFPDFPDDLAARGDFTAGWTPDPPYFISQDGYYNTIDVLSELVFNVGDGNLRIRVKNLNITNNGKITVAGTGNLILYIENSLVTTGNNFNINGDPKSVLIYYKGSNPVSLSGNFKLKGTVFCKNANVTVTGSATIGGNIITSGSAVEVSGGSANTVLSIFAPDADVELSGSGTVTGSMITKTFEVSGGGRVIYNGDIYFPDPLVHSGGSGGGDSGGGSGGGSSLSFTKGPWK